MIPNQIIKIEPNTNLEKLTKKLEQGVFINIFITRNFKAYEFVFKCVKKSQLNNSSPTSRRVGNKTI